MPNMIKYDVPEWKLFLTKVNGIYVKVVTAVS